VKRYQESVLVSTPEERFALLTRMKLRWLESLLAGGADGRASDPSQVLPQGRSTAPPL
jgi:hypothetical protein